MNRIPVTRAELAPAEALIARIIELWREGRNEDEPDLVSSWRALWPTERTAVVKYASAHPWKLMLLRDAKGRSIWQKFVRRAA